MTDYEQAFLTAHENAMRLEQERDQLRAELAALREQEPVRFERRSFRKGKLFRDWHASTANEAKSIGERMKFVNEFGEEWIHETRKLYKAPQPAIPEGWQPIETAPRENPRCLTYTPDRLCVSDEIRICPGKLIRTHSEATHWMPLPAPPMLAAQQEANHEDN